MRRSTFSISWFCDIVRSVTKRNVTTSEMYSLSSIKYVAGDKPFVRFVHLLTIN